MIAELSANMLGRTFCALGDAAAMPTGGFIAKFRDEFEAKLRQEIVTAQPHPELVNI